MTNKKTCLQIAEEDIENIRTAEDPSKGDFYKKEPYNIAKQLRQIAKAHAEIMLMWLDEMSLHIVVSVGDEWINDTIIELQSAIDIYKKEGVI